MANITAAMVKELRDKTGAGMMDCKTALNETNGDIEAAIDWLRKKGLAKAAKKAGRVAAEGLVAVESSGHQATILEVNSETDFVARNDQFQAFVREAAKIALMGDGTVEALSGAALSGLADDRQGSPAGAHRHDRREHDAAPARRSSRSRQGVIATYVHNAVTEGLGKIGVLVALEIGRRRRRARHRSAARSPCTSRRRTRSRSTPRASTRRRSSARARSCARRTPASPTMCCRRSSRAASRATTRRSPCWSRPSSTTRRRSVAQVLKEAEAKAGAPVTPRGLRALRARRGHREGGGPDFAAEVAAQAGRKG